MGAAAAIATTTTTTITTTAIITNGKATIRTEVVVHYDPFFPAKSTKGNEIMVGEHEPTSRAGTARKARKKKSERRRTTTSHSAVFSGAADDPADGGVRVAKPKPRKKKKRPEGGKPGGRGEPGDKGSAGGGAGKKGGDARGEKIEDNVPTEVRNAVRNRPTTSSTEMTFRSRQIILFAVVLLITLFNFYRPEILPRAFDENIVLPLQSAAIAEEQSLGYSLKHNHLMDTVILPSVSELRRTTDAQHVPCPHNPVNVLQGLAQPTGYRGRELLPAFSCGKVPFYTNPYVWEDRIKEHLFERMEAHGLMQCGFVGLDVGGARGDWVIASGIQAEKSKYVVIEANPELFQKMTQDFETNVGLPERVFAYHAAVQSEAAFFDYFEEEKRNETKPSNINGLWDGPTICVEAGKSHGEMQIVGNKRRDGCSNKPPKEVAVPVVTVDMVMRDFWASTISSNVTIDTGTIQSGNLFFAKLDVEGSEYEALLGAQSVFASSKTRPCYVYIEIKTRLPVYDQAFRLLRDTYGYSEYSDIDSGLWGNISYPPVGALFENEGNYEFRLPAIEMEACTERVRQQTSCTPSQRRKRRPRIAAKQKGEEKLKKLAAGRAARQN